MRPTAISILVALLTNSLARSAPLSATGTRRGLIGQNDQVMGGVLVGGEKDAFRVVGLAH